MGGAERHLYQISTGLTSRGWKVEILTLSHENPLRPQFEAHGVTVTPLTTWVPPRWFPRTLRCVLLAGIATLRMAWRFRARPVPTHFFLPQSYVLGMLARGISLSRLPVFMSRRSMNNYQKRYPFLGHLERFFHKRVIASIGNSRAVVGQLLEEGCPPEKTKLIYNGIDSGRIRADLATLSTPNPANVNIYCVANFIPYKGHSDLLNALAGIAPQGGWHATFFGRDDGILPSLKERARKLGIADRITWCESVNEPWRFMIPGHIGVLPSHEEGFPNAVLEMMACKLAVVATAVGGTPEALDGETGIVVPPRNPDALREAISKLLTFNRIRENYAERAGLRVDETFTLTACLDQYEKTYSEAFGFT